MRQFIAARMQDDGHVEVTFSPACRTALALSSPDHRFRILPQDKRKLGLLSFDVEVMADGAPPRIVPIAAEAVLVKDVVVARRSINQGQVIAGRDLKLQERRFTRMEAVGITDLMVAVGSLSGRFFRPGDMLDAQGIKSQPMVRRGERVEILIVAEGLEIKTSGKAQTSGALGDSITVRRDGSRRRQDVIEAVVTGPGVVLFRGERRVTRR
jgi:flagella basal body P-ring formation protein FlgA